MLRRLIRRGVRLAAVAGVATVVARAVQGRREGPPAPVDRGGSWPPLPDVAAAPGPDTQPLREGNGAETPSGGTEVHAGDAAEAHAADLDRQADVAAPDWEPPPGAATT